MKRASIAILFLTATMPLPAAPGAFTLSGSAYCSDVDSGQPGVHLSWTTSVNATQYDIYFPGQGKIGSVPAGGSNTYDTTYFVSIFQTRSYYLIANDASGGTATSNTVDVFIPGDVCPPRPFTVSGNASCDNGSPAVHLRWTASSQQPTFRVYRDGSQISGDLNWSNLGFNDKTAVAGHSYTYTVTATNGSKTTTAPPLNISISSTMCSSGPPPPGPFSASASAFCVNNAPAVHVSWTGSSDATSYVVSRNGAPISGTLPATAMSFDDTAAPVGQSSTYVVMASNSGGSASATAGTVVPTASVCSPPAFTLTATTTCSPIASPPLPVVTLNWSATTASSFVVIRDGAQIGSVNGNTTVFDDSGTAAGQTYMYVVRAVGAGGGSTDSNSVSVTVDPAVCQPLCEVSCAANVPAGVVGVPIPFALQQTPSCNTISATWTFGDSTTANELSPKHVYASPGTYRWSVTISGPGVQSCTNTGTVAVTAPGPQIPPKHRAARH
jgi:hypothetical protein